MTIPEIGSGLPEVVLRVAVVYLFLVVVLLISDALQNSMVGENTTLWAGPITVLTLLGLDYGLNLLTHRSRRLRRAIEGEPRLLVRDGRLLSKALREEKVEAEEVRAAVRAQGLARIEDVHLAVLETDGSISVIPMAEQRGGDGGRAGGGTA